jgi:hypothetical protein
MRMSIFTPFKCAVITRDIIRTEKFKIQGKDSKTISLESMTNILIKHVIAIPRYPRVSNEILLIRLFSYFLQNDTYINKTIFDKNLQMQKENAYLLTVGNSAFTFTLKTTYK